MHKAELASKEEATLALNVASEILDIMFPAVVTKIGLHLHEGFIICDDWKCKNEGTPIERIIKST